ncbi:MAG: dihydrofolate reductase family protein [Ghiorsea sp.]|nr:dihydrofolate reductase family protein [Ghiorsea sp.]
MLQTLYPTGGESTALKGLYLGLNLHQQAKAGEVFIYANYISSLDGRIALYNADLNAYEVPSAIANSRDWRLYQELAGQADVMLTSARYFRQLAQGKAQDLLPVGASEKYADIKLWREAQGLKPQPDVVVLSNSLDIPLVALDKVSDRQVIVLTASEDAAKIQALEDAGVVVKQTSEVTGAFVRQSLIDLNYRSADMISGPQVHATLVQDGALDELFLTTHLTLLGGEKVSGLLDVNIPQAQSMSLKSMVFDVEGNQMFQRFKYAQSI